MSTGEDNAAWMRARCMGRLQSRPGAEGLEWDCVRCGRVYTTVPNKTHRCVRKKVDIERDRARDAETTS